MEQAFRDEQMAKNEVAKFNTPVGIHVRSFRKRLADADGISAKAAIDGIVHAGILSDDSPKEVQKVTYSQEKCSEERTEITIEVV